MAHTLKISPSAQATLQEVVGGLIEAQHTALSTTLTGEIFLLEKISVYTVHHHVSSHGLAS